MQAYKGTLTTNVTFNQIRIFGFNWHMQIYVNKYESAHRRLDFFLLVQANYYGGVEGQPHIFFNIMLPHTDNLVTRPCKIAIVVLKSHSGRL